MSFGLKDPNIVARAITIKLLNTSYTNHVFLVNTNTNSYEKCFVRVHCLEFVVRIVIIIFLYTTI